MSNKKRNYHHGDLQPALIAAAREMLQTQGINGLSLRKIAERTGVSRTAAYHHFADKNALLCAIAAEGFSEWHEKSQQIFQQELSIEAKYREFVHAYVNFAVDHPDLYELMFGQTIWKHATSTEQLKAVAYASFQFQVEMTKIWQQHGIMPNEDTLRLAQVTWGTLHGIARLINDGIYSDRSHLEQMCDCAVNLLLASRQTN